VPSGKNQVQLLFRNGKVMKYPNKTFTVWRQQSCLQIHGECFQAPNISRPVSLTCIYTPGDLRTRDVSGQLDALFHLLVYAKVLKDDGLVHDVTWRRQVMNRTAPKVELTIEEVQR
jgi:Holliday junction resolvase RusA-like endonuclease